MTPLQAWLKAFRLRTLPLAFSSIILGAFLAANEDRFSTSILLFALLTTLFLQVLSNLANDYGDYVKGTDNANRVGPARTLQAGLISKMAMLNAMILFSFLSLASGVSLLYVSGAFSDPAIGIFFLALGLFCIIAAVTYTVGKNAYGYKGLGDISVLIFFGLIGVLGTHFLMTHSFHFQNLLPAFACGFLAVGVLNLNNLRDIENDRASGKMSIPAKIGFDAGKGYHTILIVSSVVCFSAFVLLFQQGNTKLIYFVLVPIYILHIVKVRATKQNKEMDKFLRQLALTSLATTFVVGIGIILG